MLDAPADYDGSGDGARGTAAQQGAGVEQYTPTNDEDEDEDEMGGDEDEGEDDDDDDDDDAVQGKEAGPSVKWLMLSTDFGNNYTWTKMPADLQSTGTPPPGAPTRLTSLGGLCRACVGWL